MTAGNGTDDSVGKLSERLLQGWTMLSESCPRKGCTVPLMRSRDNTEVSERGRAPLQARARARERERERERRAQRKRLTPRPFGTLQDIVRELRNSFLG